MEAARLNLSYTVIRAPFDGIVTRKSVHVGHRVEVGQPLMALVPIRGLYITANYKETQLTDVRVGQPADVEADIYPGYVYRAHVDSISIGTGSAFALLPPENATGNWVKGCPAYPGQDRARQSRAMDKPLRMGLSVEVTIDISDTRGPLLTSTLQRQFQERGTIPETLRRIPPPETARSNTMYFRPPGMRHPLHNRTLCPACPVLPRRRPASSRSNRPSAPWI